MKAKYYKTDDILVFKLSQEPIDTGEQYGSVIVEYDVKNRPVRIEILDASKFLKWKNWKSEKDSVLYPAASA